MRDLLRSLMTLAVLACVAHSGAQAQVIVTYTNLASWSAAAGPSTVEDFSSSAVGFSTANYGPVAFNGFSISALSNGDNVGIANGAIGGFSTTPPAPFDGQNFFGWGDGGNGNEGATTTLTFTQPVFAFGFDWFNTDSTDRYQITLSPSGQTFVSPPFDFTSQGFFGVVSDTPIDSATISTLEFGGYVDTEGFDNVRVAAVPEPTTWALIGVATLGTGAFTWKKRRKVVKKRFAKKK